MDSICEFIANDSPYYASLTAQKILNLIDYLVDFPEFGRIVPEYDNPKIRELIYKSYRIVYRLNNDIIEIAAICHYARKVLDI